MLECNTVFKLIYYDDQENVFFEDSTKILEFKNIYILAKRQFDALHFHLFRSFDFVQEKKAMIFTLDLQKYYNIYFFGISYKILKIIFTM